MLRTRAGHSVWFPLAWRAMASFEVAPSQAAFAFRTLQVVEQWRLPSSQLGPAEPPQRPPGLILEPISPLLRRGATRTTFCPPGPLPHALWAPTGGWQISPGSSQPPSVADSRELNEYGDVGAR